MKPNAKKPKQTLKTKKSRVQERLHANLMVDRILGQKSSAMSSPQNLAKANARKLKLNSDRTIFDARVNTIVKVTLEILCTE
jgi:hypothetical protein